MRQPSGSFRSGRLGERLRRRAVELESDNRLVPDNPGVVTGLDHVRRAGGGVTLGAVVVDHVHGARDDHADVMRLARLTADDRLDALGPPPTGLRTEPSRLDTGEVDDFDPGLVG